MNIFESIKSSVSNVFANKMRALLTMLGIIIGVGAVIMITSIGNGSTQQITEQLSSLGVGRLTVSLTSRNSQASDNLTMSDYELLQELDEIKLISPVYNLAGASVKLLNPKETKQASITGVTADYKDITNPTLLYGRYITDNDVENKNKVVVINDTTANKIFGYADETVLGQRITVKTWRGSHKLTVVGILENANASIEIMYGNDYPETIIAPTTTLMSMNNSKYLNSITLIVSDVDVIDQTSSLITSMLDAAHKTSGKYYVQNIMQQMDTITSTIGLVTTFISLVAGISLLVGGIGVMNIMLVTVTERTREIGIRKSIGATNRDIRIQFIIEALLMTFLGGAIGLAFGIFGGSLIAGFVGVNAVVSMQAVLLAIAISCGIGLIFGVYPANKAAMLNPIEALRYE